MTSNIEIGKVFCLLNCFDNYQICASKIIEFYIQNSGLAFKNQAKLKTLTFYWDTPYFLYQTYIPPSFVLPNISKQYSDFIVILALTAVTCANIKNCDATVFGMQGVVPSPGFSVMYSVAVQMNKLTAYWTDDLRNQWGTSDDPLLIGMSPNIQKYIWSDRNSNPASDPSGVYWKGFQPGLIPTLGLPASNPAAAHCPKVDTTGLKKNWNTFIQMLQDAAVVRDTNGEDAGGCVSKRVQTLITIGDDIISAATAVAKPKTSPWDIGANPALWWTIESVIQNNIGSLLPQEQAFVTANAKAVPSNFVSDRYDNTDIQSINLDDLYNSFLNTTSGSAVY
jgi:hypothetical protein